MNLAIKVVNFVKAGALNSRLFKQLCLEMGSEHQALLFHTKEILFCHPMESYTTATDIFQVVSNFFQ